MPPGMSSRQLQRLIYQMIAAYAGVGDATDHGTLTGLTDDDHAQYAKKASNLSDLASASTARTNLGLGALATAATINNDNWFGTDLAVANGGTGASDASGARTALGVAIGTDVQAHATTLDTLSTSFTSASGTAAASLALHEDTNNGTNKVTIIAPASVASDKVATLQDVTGTLYVSGGTDVAVADGGTGASTAADARTNLGLVIGTDVQAQDAELAALAGLASAANKIPRFTGSGTADVIDFKDEDNMASDSASAVPSQQSVKAYVDAEIRTDEEIADVAGAMFTNNTETGITATYQDANNTVDLVVADLTVAGDSGSTGMTPGDTLTIAGGTNATSAMSGDTLTVNVDDAFILNTGDVGTGVYDFGGADSFEIPNGSAPTVNAAGEIAVDTTITDHTGLVKYHDGTEELTVIAVPTANLTTTDDHVLAYDADNNEFYFKADRVGEEGGGITSVVEDTTPKLGGNLNLNTFSVGDANAADLTKLSQLTASSTELNYVDGVTSAIQTQLDGKQPLDSDLTTIAGLTATTDNFMVAVSNAWASRTPAQAAATLQVEVGKLMYPVGCIYFSTNSTNPATSLGFGTWSAFGAGRVPVGFDSGQTEFDTDEETGGAKTHTLTEAEMPSHTHIQDAHTHNIRTQSNSYALDNSVTFNAGSNREGYRRNVTQSDRIIAQNTTATNQNTGGGGAHNNLQPYIVVRMWKRTA